MTDAERWCSGDLSCVWQLESPSWRTLFFEFVSYSLFRLFQQQRAVAQCDAVYKEILMARASLVGS
jgi:hypothetical protein